MELNTCDVDASNGQLPPGSEGRPPLVNITVCVPVDIYDRAKATARGCDVSLSQFCRDAIKSHLTLWEDGEPVNAVL